MTKKDDYIYMSGREIKQALKERYEKEIAKFKDDVDYKFIEEVDGFDGCNDCYWIKPATEDSIEFVLKNRGCIAEPNKKNEIKFEL